MQSFRGLVGGYNIEEVNANIARAQQAFNDEMQLVKNELAEEVDLLQSRRQSVNLLKTVIQSRVDQEEAIKQGLVDVYLSAMQRIVETRKSAEQMQIDAMQRLASREAELIKRKEDSTKIRVDLQMMAGKYVHSSDTEVT